MSREQRHAAHYLPMPFFPQPRDAAESAIIRTENTREAMANNRVARDKKQDNGAMHTRLPTGNTARDDTRYAAAYKASRRGSHHTVLQ